MSKIDRISDNLYVYQNNFFSEPKHCGQILLYQLGEQICTEGSEITPHKQVCYELTYILAGSGIVQTNGTMIPVSQSDCVLSFPSDRHAIYASPNESMRFAFAGFGPGEGETVRTLLERLQEMFYQTDQRKTRIAQMEDHFFEIFSELNELETFGPQMIGLKICQLLIEFIRNCAPPATEAYRQKITHSSMLAYQIQNYIANHIYDLKNLSELSEIFHYDYQYIAKCFKAVTGMTLNRFYGNKKIQLARRLLEQNLSITEISEKLGYSSIHVFTRSFKNGTGITPSDYKNQWNKKKK